MASISVKTPDYNPGMCLEHVEWWLSDGAWLLSSHAPRGVEGGESSPP